MDDSPIIYGLEDFQARALCAQSAETEKINFFVGTQSMRRMNQVQLIEYDDDTNIVSKQTFEHSAGEIWHITAAPQSSNVIATVYKNTQDNCGQTGAAVWRLPPEGSNNLVESNQLQWLCGLKKDDGISSDPSQIVSLVWTPEDDSHLVTLVDRHILYWDLQVADSTAKIVGEVSLEARGSTTVGSGRWYPHQQGSQIAVTFGPGVRAWDLRTFKPTWSLDNAHIPLVRDLDFNPNMQYHLATCGDDCCTKFWDIRNTEKPLKVFNDHSHWVWSIRFNASYDQLVLTCSSDQRVILCNIPSIASQPFGAMTERDESSSPGNKNRDKQEFEEGVLQIYEDHEDSVYAAEWSSADFWTFASLSYDGRFVINKVPRGFKYKQFL